MTQRIMQWSSPWILQSPIIDPVTPPWELPQESELQYACGTKCSTPWSTALPIQDYFYSRPPTQNAGRTPGLCANGNGLSFYTGQAYMTPGVRPGVGGGWRAYNSEFQQNHKMKQCRR